MLCFFKTTLIHRSCFTIIVLLKGFTKKNVPQTIFSHQNPSLFIFGFFLLSSQTPTFHCSKSIDVPSLSSFFRFFCTNIFVQKIVPKSQLHCRNIAEKTVTNPINLGLQKTLKKNLIIFFINNNKADQEMVFSDLVCCYPFFTNKKQEKELWCMVFSDLLLTIWCFPIRIWVRIRF